MVLETVKKEVCFFLKYDQNECKNTLNFSFEQIFKL